MNIDTYAEGLSLTLFFKDTASTRDVNKALEGTEVDGCVSCML